MTNGLNENNSHLAAPIWPWLFAKINAIFLKKCLTNMRARSIMITSNKETRRSRFFYRNGAGAPVVSQRLFSCVARKRVTVCRNLVIVFILARGRQ